MNENHAYLCTRHYTKQKSCNFQLFIRQDNLCFVHRYGHIELAENKRSIVSVGQFEPEPQLHTYELCVFKYKTCNFNLFFYYDSFRFYIGETFASRIQSLERPGMESQSCGRTRDRLIWGATPQRMFRLSSCWQQLPPCTTDTSSSSEYSQL